MNILGREIIILDGVPLMSDVSLEGVIIPFEFPAEPAEELQVKNFPYLKHAIDSLDHIMKYNSFIS